MEKGSIDGLEFRMVSAAEIPLVHALWDESGLPFRPEGRDTVERMSAELERGSAFLPGAFDGGELVGVIMGTSDGRKGWVNRLAVKSSWRGRGLARRLIALCEKELERSGLGIICCLIEDWNEASLKLFRSEGYDLRKDILYLRKTPGGEKW